MKKKMWFVLCIMTSVLLTTACGEKKEYMDNVPTMGGGNRRS